MFITYEDDNLLYINNHKSLKKISITKELLKYIQLFIVDSE